MRMLFNIVLALPVAALAQTGEIPKSVLDSLSRDLATLQKSVLEVQAQQQALEAKTDKLWSFPDRVTVTSPTYVKVGAAEKAASLFKVEKGTTFPVVSQAGGWYAVEFDETFKGMKTGWLQAAAAVPTPQVFATPAATNSNSIFSTLTEQAAKLKQTYQNNPYVNVSGFSVTVVPPSISINFEFKK